MDMPNNPLKKQKSAEEFNQQLDEDQDQQCFSSFDSNGPRHDHDHMRESSLSIDQNGFRNYNGYREKTMSFPEVPQHLGQLYQIYLHNVNRKKQLKKTIEQLIQKQIRAIRIAYDKENYSIQEYIDLDQKSQQYLASKENYEKREKELQRLTQQYRELKIMQVQSLMVLDPLLKKTLSNFTQKTKQILHVDVREQTVMILTKQKHKVRKLRKQKPKKTTKKQLKLPQQQNQQVPLQNRTRSRNTSRTASQDDQNQQQKQKIRQKYLLRNFKYFKTQHGVSFQPFQQLVELPDKEWRGVVFCDLFSERDTRFYYGYQDRRVYLVCSFLESLMRNSEIKEEYGYDSAILYCNIVSNMLYIGLTNGIIYKYSISQPRKQPSLTLQQILVCSNPTNQNSQISSITTSQNPNIILFVTEHKKLYQLNTNNYTTYLLSQLPQKIKYIDDRLIVTQSCVYLDYYVNGGGGVGHGKAVLQFNAKIKGIMKGRDVVKVEKVKDEYYVVMSQGNGDFVVERLSKAEEPAKK